MNPTKRVMVLAFAVACGPALAEETTSTAASSPMQNGIGLGLAPRVGGLVSTSKLGPFVLGGLSVDWFLPVLDRQLVLGLDGSYTQPGYSGSGNDPRVGNYTDKLTTSELKIGLDVIYRFFNATHDFVPYAGVGIVEQLLRTSETTSMSPGANVEQSSAFGGEALGGADYRLGPGFLFGELRFVYSALNQQLTGSTNAGNFALSLGYRLTF